MSRKIKVEVIHVVELYTTDDGQQMYQVKVKTENLVSPLGKTKGKYYYFKGMDVEVEVGDELVIDLDMFDTYKEEFKPKDEEKVIILTYLKQKPEMVDE